MTWELEQVAGPFTFSEGPTWNGEALLFSDLVESQIHRFDPETEECAVHLSETNGANGLKTGPDGKLYACEDKSGRVVRYEPDGSVTVVADTYHGKRLNSPNDLAFDAEGRLWFTDPYYGDDRDSLELDHESVYRATPHGDGGWNVTRMTTDATRPNGILVAPDQQRIHVAQLDYGGGEDRELRSYPIREDGTLGEYEVLHNFYPHRGIDGMCLDSDGNIIACAGSTESGPGPMIYVFAPNGRVLETHPFPGTKPTNCTFGDDDRQTLYVTGNARLYRTRTDRSGYLEAPQG